MFKLLQPSGSMYHADLTGLTVMLNFWSHFYPPQKKLIHLKLFSSKVIYVIMLHNKFKCDSSSFHVPQRGHLKRACFFPSTTFIQTG